MDDKWTWDDERRRAEVLRYLRYKGGDIDPAMAMSIRAGMESLREKTRPRYAWQLFDLDANITSPIENCTQIGRHDGEKFNQGSEELRVKGTALVLTGKAIARHLRGCESLALMAATLGAEADRLIQTAYRRDMTAAVILDAAASQYIEEICDMANAEIADAAAKAGCETTFRFSPGYGDLPLAIQPTFLTLLDAGRRIGLTVTDGNMLVPQKSVTAIVGFRSK